MSIFTNKIPDIIDNIYQSIYILSNINNINIQELSEDVNKTGELTAEKIIEHIDNNNIVKPIENNNIIKPIETKEDIKQKNIIEPIVMKKEIIKPKDIIEPLDNDVPVQDMIEVDEEEKKEEVVKKIEQKPKQFIGGNNKLIDFALL